MVNKLKVGNLKSKRIVVSSCEALKEVSPIKWTDDVLKGEKKVVIEKYKVNVLEFLLSSNVEVGTYALVYYENKIEATYFSKYDFEDEDIWFLESPCELYSICKVDEPIDVFAKEYISGLLEEGSDEQDYIDKFIKPMIVDNVLYEIENFQYAPYLPKEVDKIELLTERECLKYMLKQNK